MIKTTLKKKYETQKINELQQRLKVVDQKIISEQILDEQLTSIIVEKFDKAKMTAAIDIIKKLEQMNFGKISTLNTATDRAFKDIGNEIDGQNKDGFFKSIFKMFKNGPETDNALIRALDFSDALQNFCISFEQYLATLKAVKNAPDNREANVAGDEKRSKPLVQSLMATLTGTSDTTKISDEAKQKLKFVEKLIIEEFSQQNSESSWVKKYFDGSFKKLATEILQQTVPDLKQMCESVKNATSGVKELKVDAQTAADEVKDKQPETDSKVGKGNTNPKLGEYANSLKPHAEKLGIKNVNSLLKALDKLGMLK